MASKGSHPRSVFGPRVLVVDATSVGHRLPETDVRRSEADARGSVSVRSVTTPPRLEVDREIRTRRPIGIKHQRIGGYCSLALHLSIPFICN